MSDIIKEWLESNVVNYRKKHGQDSIKKSDLDHIIDWLKSSDSVRQRKRLSRVSPKDALILANKWTEKLNKKFEKVKELGKDQDGVNEILSFKNGYKIVELVSEYSYEREGSKMGHCVGSYHGKSVTIFSLRDEENEPHCTIEFNKKEKSILQIKGKANKNVASKYHYYIINFLNNLDYDLIDPYDLENIDCKSFGSYIYKKDKEVKEIKVNKSLNIKNIGVKDTFDLLVVNGDLLMDGFNLSKKIAKELVVYGDLVIENSFSLLRIADKIKVIGNVEIVECENVKALGSDIQVSGHVDIIDCVNFRQKLKIPHSIEIYN